LPEIFNSDVGDKKTCGAAILPTNGAGIQNAHPAWLYLPLRVTIQLFFIRGICYLLAALSMLIRDMREIPGW